MVIFQMVIYKQYFLYKVAQLTKEQSLLHPFSLTHSHPSSLPTLLRLLLVSKIAVYCRNEIELIMAYWMENKIASIQHLFFHFQLTVYLLNGAAIVHLKNMTLQGNIYYIACHFKLNASIGIFQKEFADTSGRNAN